MRGRERRQMLAVAEADLERARRARGRTAHRATAAAGEYSTPYRGQSSSSARVWPDGHAAGAHHEAADGAVCGFVHAAASSDA